MFISFRVNMEEFLREFQKFLTKFRELENAVYRIKNLVFPTGSGRFSPPKYAGDPPTPAEGDLWYNTSTHKFRGRTNSASVDLH